MITYKLHSDEMVSAPGIVRWAQNGAKFKKDREAMARVIAAGWPILPWQAVMDILDGKCDIDDDDNSVSVQAVFANPEQANAAITKPDALHEDAVELVETFEERIRTLLGDDQPVNGADAVDLLREMLDDCQNLIGKPEDEVVYDELHPAAIVEGVKAAATAIHDSRFDPAMPGDPEAEF